MSFKKIESLQLLIIAVTFSAVSLFKRGTRLLASNLPESEFGVTGRFVPHLCSLGRLDLDLGFRGHIIFIENVSLELLPDWTMVIVNTNVPMYHQYQCTRRTMTQQNYIGMTNKSHLIKL